MRILQMGFGQGGERLNRAPSEAIDRATSQGTTSPSTATKDIKS